MRIMISMGMRIRRSIYKDNDKDKANAKAKDKHRDRHDDEGGWM